jgi:hypothetical protein
MESGSPIAGLPPQQQLRMKTFAALQQPQLLNQTPVWQNIFFQGFQSFLTRKHAYDQELGYTQTENGNLRALPITKLVLGIHGTLQCNVVLFLPPL